MKIALLFFIATTAILYNIYYDGYLVDFFSNYRKYYKMALIALVALISYMIMTRLPTDGANMLICASNAIKYLPAGRQTMDLVEPIMRFSGENRSQFKPTQQTQLFPKPPFAEGPKQKGSGGGGGGGGGTKRSVSETKKKYVASNQDWKCMNCSNQLNAWFEVDHRVRLEYGGTNDIANLVALCRECHGEKTALEKM